MGIKKKLLTSILCAILAISTICVFSITVDAAKSCPHKKTTTTYQRSGNIGIHYKIIKCTNCKKQISKKSESHSWSSWKVTSIKKDYHIKKRTCKKCDLGWETAEDHKFKNKKCTVCGYKKK